MNSSWSFGQLTDPLDPPTVDDRYDHPEEALVEDLDPAYLDYLDGWPLSEVSYRG